MSEKDFWSQMPQLPVLQGDADLPDWEDLLIQPTSEPALGFEVG
jgi:hypothetical protein